MPNVQNRLSQQKGLERGMYSLQFSVSCEGYNSNHTAIPICAPHTKTAFDHSLQLVPHIPFTTFYGLHRLIDSPQLWPSTCLNSFLHCLSLDSYDSLPQLTMQDARFDRLLATLFGNVAAYKRKVLGYCSTWLMPTVNCLSGLGFSPPCTVSEFHSSALVLIPRPDSYSSTETFWAMLGWEFTILGHL